MPESVFTAAQAAARLGVKVETLYAYVSRGRLTRRRTAQGSLFDPLEVEALARAGAGRAGAASPGGAGAPLVVLDTDIALIEDDHLYLRGVPADELAAAHSFEAVAGWLWGGELDAPPVFAADAADLRAVRRVQDALPDGASLLQRIEAAVLVLGADDAFRADSAPDTLRRVGERAIAGAAAAVSGDDDPAPTSIAGRLARGWAAGTADAESLASVVDAALVLLVDHDLAVSTLAVRAAASARASGYAVICAGLGALDSPLHGNASQLAAGLVRRVIDGASARTVLAEAVAGGRGLPGFGHFLYRGIDPRAAELMRLLRRIPAAGPAMAAVDALAEEARTRTRRHPNVDLALGALVVAFGLPADAGSAVFALARSAGWIAHALDEYQQRPLRLRPQGRYVERRA